MPGRFHEPGDAQMNDEAAPNRLVWQMMTPRRMPPVPVSRYGNDPGDIPVIDAQGLF